MKPNILKKMKADIVNTIPLSLVLEEIMGGTYIENDKKWELENGDNIQVMNKRWYNWSRQKGGSDTVSLIYHWIELGADAGYTLKDLQPIYNKYEKIKVKDDLDAALSNDNVQAKKPKI
jgi:hypothetical protein